MSLLALQQQRLFKKGLALGKLLQWLVASSQPIEFKQGWDDNVRVPAFMMQVRAILDSLDSSQL